MKVLVEMATGTAMSLLKIEKAVEAAVAHGWILQVAGLPAPWLALLRTWSAERPKVRLF